MHEPITAEDLAAALAGLAIAQAAAARPQHGNEFLERLANELDGLLERMPAETAAAPGCVALALAARMLMASEPL